MNSIGKMRYQVKLQSPTSTTDAGGGRSQVWSTLGTIWANIVPKSGTERYKHDQIEDTTTHDVYIRYRSDIDAKYRILYGSRVFSIKAILNVEERDRFYLLSCTEGAVGAT
jgi:SPP1 family predicted phage head-tail adaptor